MNTDMLELSLVISAYQLLSGPKKTRNYMRIGTSKLS